MAVVASRLLLTAAVVAASACRGAGNPAEEMVRSLTRAADHRDAPAIVAALSPDFEGSAGMGRPEVDAELRRLFAAYASVDVSVSDLETVPYPDFTLARFRVEFRGAVRRIGGLEGILPTSARYRFELRLVPEGRRFRVASAHWEEMDSGTR